ncbi:MAG: hypothetical protein OEW85_13995 [Acidimicrobiia bacterium]|nr:hypothetical protein [Acidimicrobiia bacterium]
MKKGRHRRFEEARALKRSDNVDYDDLFDSLNPDDDQPKPEHEAWADLAENDSDDPWADVAAEFEQDPADDEAEAESA